MQAVWQRFTDAYFLRHTPEEIAWHTQLLARARQRRHSARSCPCSSSRVAAAPASRPTRRIRQHSFARTTALLDQLGLNIVDARITPTADGFSLDVYHVLEDTGAEITDPARIRDIEQQLRARAVASRTTPR